MSRARLVVAAVVGILLVVAVAWYFARGRSSSEVQDLVTLFPQAAKKSNRAPVDSAFAVETVTIDGDAKRSIVARPFARITYDITVPRDAVLETWFAIKPEAWTQATDGAQFRIGVSEGRTYDELMRQVVRPARGDRRWMPARIDLAAYEGRTIKLIFNTDAGPPGDSDTRFDEAVWGEPRIVRRR